jgi:hypothetical protein
MMIGTITITISVSCHEICHMKKERGDDVEGRPGHVQQTPGHQFRHAVRVRRHAADDPPHRHAVVIGQRQLLQVTEQLLAQVVANPLAQDAGQVDEDEDCGRLHHDQRGVALHDHQQIVEVARGNGVIDHDARSGR